MIHPQGTQVIINKKLQRYEVFTDNASLHEVFKGVRYIDKLAEIEKDQNGFEYALYTLEFSEMLESEPKLLTQLEKDFIELMDSMVKEREENERRYQSVR
jgi:hypothetical protein